MGGRTRRGVGGGFAVRKGKGCESLAYTDEGACTCHVNRTIPLIIYKNEYVERTFMVFSSIMTTRLWRSWFAEFFFGMLISDYLASKAI